MHEPTALPKTTADDSDAPPRLALRPKDAARALAIGPRKLWELTNRNAIPHCRIGRAIVYPIAELECWLADEARKAVRR